MEESAASPYLANSDPPDRSDGTAEQPRSAREHVQRLFLSHGGSIQGYIRSLVPHETDADEIYQQTFVTTLEKAEQYDRGRPFQPWVFGIAKNKILAWIRDRQRQRLMLSTETIEHLTDKAGQRPPVEHQLRHLRQCLEQLTPTTRRLLQMRYFDNLAGEKIAEEMSIHRRTVYKALTRARLELRDCMERAMAREDFSG